MTVSRGLLMDSQEHMDTAILSDFRAMGDAMHNLGVHTAAAVGSLHTNEIMQWLAFVAAVYLLVIDRTNWRTDFLTALLVPYIGLNLPGSILSWIRSDFGAWLAFIAVILRLFFPRHFPDELELPAALILILVVSPSALVYFRTTLWAEIISLAIGGYLLFQHINAAGGFRKAFAEQRGVPITLGILLLFVTPVWRIIPH